ncbi:hypothetical protein V5O48_016132, partial [Marasmius crinis-equi]
IIRSSDEAVGTYASNRACFPLARIVILLADTLELSNFGCWLRRKNGRNVLDVVNSLNEGKDATT